MSDDCRAEALRVARRLRLQREQLHRAVTDGRASLGEILSDPRDCVVSMPVADLLAWVDETRPEPARSRQLGESGIDPGQRVGTLLPQARQRLVAWLEDSALPLRGQASVGRRPVGLR